MFNLDSKILKTISKPARYVGGEVNEVIKSSNVRSRVVLCYPNLYEKAMSNNIVNLLYDNINLIDSVWCKRCFAPDLDFEDVLRKNNIQLYSLEDYISIKENDILLFVIEDELDFTNVINMLELSGIYLNKDNINSNHKPQIWFLPLNNINIEPIKNIADKVFEDKEGKENIQNILNMLNAYGNVNIQHITNGIVPSIKINNSSIIIDFEYMKEADSIIRYIEKSNMERGINKVSFLNYAVLDEYKFCEIVYKIKMNMPSIKIVGKNINFNDFRPELFDVLLPCMEHSTVYFDVITISSKLKERIKLGIDKDLLLSRLAKVFKNNRNSIRLDFNVGFPEETYEDIDNIFELLDQIVNMYSQNKAKDKFSMKVKFHYYIPDIRDRNNSMININKLETKLRYIKEKQHDSVIKVEVDDMSSYTTKMLLKNGNESIYKVIYNAYKLGARFDKDVSKYNKNAWEKAIYDNISLVNESINK